MNQINFNFTVSAEDAYNILHALRDAKSNALENRIDAIVNQNEAEADWFADQATYWQELIDLVADSATPIEEDD